MAAPHEGLQSPGEGWRYLRFSDGEGAWISPKATDEQWAQIKQNGENERDAKYQKQAQDTNAPVTTEDKVYSATGIYPNNVHGHITAWLDHNAGGNALNRAVASSPTAQSVVNAVSPVLASVNRMATGAIEANPYVRAYDLGITGYNVAKHLAGKVYPQLNDMPDATTALSVVHNVAGTPELRPDASPAQRILENTGSIAAGGGPAAWTRNALAENFVRSGTSYLGGLGGEELAGEPGQFIGSFLGGSPEIARASLQRTTAPLFRGRNTQTVSDAAARLGVQPSLGSVSNAAGRLFEKAAAATPGVGSPVRAAQERFNEAIRERQQQLGEDVFGEPLPANISDEDIGRSVLEAARAGATNVTRQASDTQNQLATDIGPNTPVDARGVYRGPAGYATARATMPPGTYPAYAARLDQIRQMAVEAQHPFFQNFWGQLNAGEVPYARFQQLRNVLGADLPGFEGMTKGQQDQLYEAMTDAMRDAAFARGGQALADRFDAANAQYKSLIGAGGQREKLEAIGGKPQAGGWEQFFGPQGQIEPTGGVDFTGGKDEGQAATWFNSKMRSPQALDPLANPNITPNDFWRNIVGQWLATRGQTREGTFRPDQMATAFGGEANAPGTGVGEDVKTQLFTGPQGQPTGSVQDMNDLATLGRNAVVAQERAGLTNTAASVYAFKKVADWLQQGLGTVGGLAAMTVAGRNLSDPEFVNAVRGRGTPLVNSLYAGVPAATQSILQYQNNPPATYDPLGYSVTRSQNPTPLQFAQ